MPDTLGIALERWNPDKQGVQQTLIADAPAAPEVAAVVVRSSQGLAETQQEFGGFDNSQAFMGTCPDCGSQLEYAEGCVKCHVCGFSECG